MPVVSENHDIEFRIPSDPSCWDDMAVRYRKGPWIPLAKGGGIYPASAAKGAKVRFHRIANSLVADIEAPVGVEEVRFGESAFPEATKRVLIPYLTYKHIEPGSRPAVMATKLDGVPFFFAATWDWTQTGCSEPFCDAPAEGVQMSNGGVRYIPKTDGSRNPCRERFVWSVGLRCEDVFPAIPNPPSPYRSVMADLAFLSVTNSSANVVLADNLNRGVYVFERACFNVTNGAVLDVRQPLLLSGKLWKDGEGTLVLGNVMSHEASDGGDVCDVPRIGSNLVEVVNGTVRIENADALSGSVTSWAKGTRLASWISA